MSLNLLIFFDWFVQRSMNGVGQKYRGTRNVFKQHITHFQLNQNETKMVAS